MQPDFKDIKRLYIWFESQIKKTYKETDNVCKWTDPYQIGFDFISIFSPIEKITWDALRYYGHAPFYPQYPVGKYFLDFGNPIVKVGIECDGKQFHKDKEKDLQRDIELKELGWIIYRISGSDCNKTINTYDINYDCVNDVNYSLMRELSETIDGLIKAISMVHFGKIIHGDKELIINGVCACLRNKVSLYSLDYEKKLLESINNLN